MMRLHFYANKMQLPNTKSNFISCVCVCVNTYIYIYISIYIFKRCNERSQKYAMNTLHLIFQDQDTKMLVRLFLQRVNSAKENKTEDHKIHHVKNIDTRKKIIYFKMLFLCRAHSPERPPLDSNLLPADYETRAQTNALTGDNLSQM